MLMVQKNFKVLIYEDFRRGFTVKMLNYFSPKAKGLKGVLKSNSVTIITLIGHATCESLPLNIFHIK
jgi:hypothetical protein